MVRDAEGRLQPATWHDAMVQMAGRLSESSRSGLRFLASAHASLEELFLLKRIATDIGVDAPGVHVSWRYREKSQPAGAAFRVPAVDAPNVEGARDLGLAGPGVEADLAPLRAAVEQGRVAALYVLDPGPEGSLGDVSWIVDARARGALSLLIVQGVRMTALAHAADLVLPGAAFVEKEASYTNDQGHVQGGARVMSPPGDAMEDWQILTKLAVALDFPVPYPDVHAIRVDIAAVLAAGPPAYAGLASLAFAKPVPVSTWLQTSNPSERWKWDLMYQDVPPVKLAVEPAAIPRLDVVPPQDAE
jgi:predicted molibdopterin-dependent oxidoreductase YjgC